jgi:hypothetical protein
MLRTALQCVKKGGDLLQYIQTLWYTVHMDAIPYSREANLNNYTAQISPS